jgi:hypothetical protein
MPGYVPSTKDLVGQRMAPKAKTWTPAQHAATTGIRLSETGKCPRLQALRILKAPGDPYTGTSAPMTAGKNWEDYIRLVWRDAYPDTQASIPVETPYGVGEADLFIPSLRKLVEVKSTTADRAQWLPDAEHVSQLMLYGHFWPRGDGAPWVPDMELAYCLRDTGEVVSIVVPYDAAYAQALVGILDQIHLGIQKGQPLPIPLGYKGDKFPCSWRYGTPDAGRCRFWINCWQANPSSGQLEPRAEFQEYATINPARGKD